MRDSLIFLGYSTNPNVDQNDNDLGFFGYDDYTEKEKEDYLGFRKHNEKVMAEIGTGPEAKEYVINQDRPIGSMIYQFGRMSLGQDCRIR